MKKLITYGKPKFSIEELSEISNVLNSGWVGTGKKTKQFEKNFLKYKDAKYGVALNSCTSALFLSLYLLNLKKNDEVITTSLTFCSTVNSIINVGAKPILIDINSKTLQIDEDQIEKKINKNTKAIIVVHMHGYPSNMNKIIKLANKYSLKVIEDCAHSIETKYNGQHTGTFGNFGCFSFYSTKNITTIEGGFLICKKKSDYNKALTLSLHGMSADAYRRYSNKKFKKYDVKEPGFKMNLPDINSSIGIIQLKNIERKRSKRKKIWEIYQKEFKKTKFITPSNISKNIKHAYHIYYLRVRKNSKFSRDQIIDILYKNKIGVGIHYESISSLSFYKKYFKGKRYINAENFGKNTFSIPLTPYLKINEVKRIVNVIKKIDSKNV